jgi:hypothetical protein
MTAMRAPAAEPGHIALHGGDARIEVVPAQGGRVRSLRLAGREWLVPSDGVSAPRSGIGVLAGAGWDECAPAAGAGTMPEWVKGLGGRAIPPGGEARLQMPSVDLRTTAAGHQLTCRWQGERLPWTLTRTLLVRPDGSVEARYEALTTGDQRLPFLWSACLLLPLDQRTRLRMPAVTRFRVQAVTGAEGDALATGAHQWPRLTLGGRARDLSEPWQLPKTSMVTGWLDLAGSRSAVQVTQGDRELTITMDGEGVPHCGVVLDRGGVRAGAKRSAFSRGLPPALALMPSLGAPDRYSEALGDWQSITWLVPGEPRHWSMILRAGTHA